MKMNLVISFVSFIFILECTKAARVPRQIIGGENVDIKDYPYQVSLRYRGVHGCGGVIIGEKHILTAAHCVNGNFRPPFIGCTVVTGTSSSKTAGHSYRVVGVRTYPGTIMQDAHFIINDIAVLKLMENIRFDDNQKSVGLPSSDIVSGSKGIVTGWGSTVPQGDQISEYLQMLEMTILSTSACKELHDAAYPGYVLHKNQLCIHHSVGHGVCVGDSGGPVVINNIVVGIISYGPFENCATGDVDVVTNVFAYKDFIEYTLNT